MQLEVRAATGAQYILVVFDGKRTKKTMFLQPSAGNTFEIHIIKKP
jgi:hypothetical protein